LLHCSRSSAESGLSSNQPVHRRTKTYHAPVHQGCADRQPRWAGELSTTAGSDALRNAIANWLAARYGIPKPDAKTQVLPVNGSREALFAFAQAVIDRTVSSPAVVCPNPFYQIYEGATLLAGATPFFLNTLPEDGYALNFAQLPEDIWQRTQLIYVCSPGNPTGCVMPLKNGRHCSRCPTDMVS